MPADGQSGPTDLEQSIAVLGLSVRATNCLRARGIWKVGQLLKNLEKVRSRKRGVGREVLYEIESKLQKRGLSLAGGQEHRSGKRARHNGRQGFAATGPQPKDGDIQQQSGTLRGSAADHRQRPSGAEDQPNELAPSGSSSTIAWRGAKNEVRLYRVADTWVVRLEVTQKMLRGGGRALPACVGEAIGCEPGQPKRFHARTGPIFVTWPSGRPTGLYLGSIDGNLKAEAAREGDFVFLAFQSEFVSVRIVRAAELRRLAPFEQVARLVGLPADSVKQNESWRAIGTAIGIPVSQPAVFAEEVYACLMRRGENSLAGLVHKAMASSGSIIDQLEGLLGL